MYKLRIWRWLRIRKLAYWLAVAVVAAGIALGLITLTWPSPATSTPHTATRLSAGSGSTDTTAGHIGGSGHVVAMAPPSTSTTARPTRGSMHVKASVKSLQLNSIQLPAVSSERWTPSGTPMTRDVTGHDVSENECTKVHDATSWTQQAFAGGRGGNNPAFQDTFIFNNAATAQSAYQHMTVELAACQETTRALQAKNKITPDATVAKTASMPSASAWKRRWTGVTGMSDAEKQTNHIYLAVSSDRLIVLQFTELSGNATPYNVIKDSQTLSMLKSELTKH
jgi:hypothetical protein